MASEYRIHFWLLLIACLGCGGGNAPLPMPRPEAQRRVDERERIAKDMEKVGRFYKQYAAGSKDQTTSGFWKFLEAQESAGPICRSIKEQQYAIQIPNQSAGGIVGYETDADHDMTRVVVLADGTVNKAMPEGQFQEATLKVRQ